MLVIIFTLLSLLCCGVVFSFPNDSFRAPLGKNYSVVLVGGGLYDDNADVWNKIIELGGGVGKARFGVVSAASEDPCCDEDSSWALYQELLTKYGAAEVYYIPVTVDTKGNNSNPEVIAHVRTLTGFFFGGGDQLRIIYSFYNGDPSSPLSDDQEGSYSDLLLYEPSGVLQAIKQTLLATGGVVAGTSAGTDCQTSKIMITGGESFEALRDGSQVFWRPVELPDLTQLTAYGSGGIGLFPHGLLDTHFANRGRHGRLVKLLADTGDLTSGFHRAFGVDENTALVVTGSWQARQASVIGQRGVWVFDTSFSFSAGRGGGSSSDDAVDDVDGTTEGTSTIAGVYLTRLSYGDVLDLNTFELHPAPYKQPIAEESVEPAATSSDVFAEGTFEVDRIVQSLLQSSTSQYTFGLTADPASAQAGAGRVYLPQEPQRFIMRVGKNWAHAYAALNVAQGQQQQQQQQGQLNATTPTILSTYGDDAALSVAAETASLEVTRRAAGTSSLSLSATGKAQAGAVLGYGGVNPATGEYSYCFDGLWMSLAPYRRQQQ